MEKFINNLKRQAAENPVVALGIAAALLTAMSKVMDSNTSRVSARTHAREVDRRIIQGRR